MLEWNSRGPDLNQTKANFKIEIFCAFILAIKCCVSVIGCFKSLLPHTISAREHDSTSFSWPHIYHSATWGICGTETQHPLPFACLPVLPIFQVRVVCPDRQTKHLCHKATLPGLQLLIIHVFLSFFLLSLAWQEPVDFGEPTASWSHTLCALCGVSFQWSSSKIPLLLD